MNQIYYALLVYKVFEYYIHCNIFNFKCYIKYIMLQNITYIIFHNIILHIYISET